MANWWASAHRRPGFRTRLRTIRCSVTEPPGSVACACVGAVIREAGEQGGRGRLRRLLKRVTGLGGFLRTPSQATDTRRDLSNDARPPLPTIVAPVRHRPANGGSTATHAESHADSDGTAECASAVCVSMEGEAASAADVERSTSRKVGGMMQFCTRTPTRPIDGRSLWTCE